MAGGVALRGCSGLGRGRREDERPRKGTVGVLCVSSSLFVSLCLKRSHQSSGRLGQPGRPTEAHKPKPGPTAGCRGVPGAATPFNSGTQSHRRGREVCSPCSSVGKKQMRKITRQDIAYNGDSFIRQKPLLPSHGTRLNLGDFHLRHWGALWLRRDGFHARLHPSKEQKKGIGWQVFLLGGPALLTWASI